MARPSGRDVARALEAAREGDHDTLRLLTTGRKAASAALVLVEALCAAAESGHVDALKALLQFGALAAGAPPGADEDRTPLAAACAAGHAECAAVLLAHGAPVDAAPQSGGTTALHLACAEGHADCAALLIRHGASVDLGGGETPLEAALNGGHAACATLLMDNGARAAVDCLVGSGFIRHRTSCRDLAPRLLAAGADANFRNKHGYTPLTVATYYGISTAVRALCAIGADASAADSCGRIALHWVCHHFFVSLDLEDTEDKWFEQITNSLAYADELIERGRTETLLTMASFAEDGGPTALERGLHSYREAVSEVGNSDSLLQLRDGFLALMLARWPLSAPLPDYDGVGALLPAAVGHAQTRLEVLRSGQGDDAAGVQQQAALTAAFLQRVQDACGGAVAPAHATFARFRFVAGGGLERAWAEEREVHRFPVERVALARAALQVASDAQAAAAERCVPLLRELSVAGSGRRSSREAEKLRYVAAVAVGRWGTIGAAVSHAEEGVRGGEAALDAAVAEAEAQVGRLLQAKAATEVAAARVAAPAG